MNIRFVVPTTSYLLLCWPSAALEKPFKQDNLSASRHCSAMFPRARTRQRGCLIGNMKQLVMEYKGIFLTVSTVCHQTSRYKHKHPRSKYRNFHPNFIIHTFSVICHIFFFFHLFQAFQIYLAVSCVCLLFHAQLIYVALCSHWKQLLLSMKSMGVLDIRCDSWVRTVKELYCPSSHCKVCLETNQQCGNITMKYTVCVNSYHMASKGAIVPFHYRH